MDSVMLTMKIEMKLDDFYKLDGPMLFIDNMAAHLGIPNDKLRIVSITEGSVIIDHEIILDDKTKNQGMVKKVIDA
jgi:hypothetical protein